MSLRPESGQRGRRLGTSALCPISGCEQSQQSGLYSITSLASATSLSDTVRSSAFAVLRLIASSNLLGRWSLIDHTCLGQSGGLAPISLPLFQGIRFGRRED
jgi:hypothetical protein